MDNHGNRVTIKSIAEQLGVSFSTVSKALNNDPHVKEKTRQMVVEKAKEMHYTQNFFAKGLRNRTSRTVAVIANDVSVLALSEMISRITIELAAHGYSTMICDSMYDEKIEESNIDSALSRMPEALIFLPLNPNEKVLDHIRSVRDKTLILGEAPGGAISQLVVDHKLAGFLAADHMLTCGSRNNMVFCSPLKIQSSEMFMAGIREAYEKHGIAFSDDCVSYFKPDTKTADKEFTRRWKAESDRDGVICVCDSMALGVYSAAARLGLSIPEDLSVTGYDDSPYNDHLNPPLTSIYLPKEKMTEECARFLIDRLLNGDNSIQTNRLKPQLVVRESVKKQE